MGLEKVCSGIHGVQLVHRNIEDVIKNNEYEWQVCPMYVNMYSMYVRVNYVKENLR